MDKETRFRLLGIEAKLIRVHDALAFYDLGEDRDGCEAEEDLENAIAGIRKLLDNAAPPA